MTGRLRIAASGLCLSVFGRPVAGSLGSLSATIVPQSSAPQLAIRTVAAPPSVSQVPLGSAASDVESKPPSATAAIALRRSIIMVPSDAIVHLTMEPVGSAHAHAFLHRHSPSLRVHR